MPHNRKFFFNKTCIFVTTRTVEGLPFTAASYMNSILESILARAQKLYPVTIFSYVFLANHLHIGLVVEDPENIPKFFKYVKGESAGAINKLLRRSKKKVWEEGYDSPTILDAERAIQTIVYIYANPAEADLVDTIGQYPGLSSWKAFKDASDSVKVCPWIRRKRIPPIPKKNLTRSAQDSLNKHLIEESRVSFQLTVRPNAWVECFPELKERQIGAINEEICRRVKEKEDSRAKQRRKPPLGSRKLIALSHRIPYFPSKRGQRMLVLSSDPQLRTEVVEKLKFLMERASEVHALWKSGKYDVHPPPGFFPPAQIYRANFVSVEMA